MTIVGVEWEPALMAGRSGSAPVACVRHQEDALMAAVSGSRGEPLRSVSEPALSVLVAPCLDHTLFN